LFEAVIEIFAPEEEGGDAAVNARGASGAPLDFGAEVDEMPAQEVAAGLE
jgi:hypothetical protein